MLHDVKGIYIPGLFISYFFSEKIYFGEIFSDLLPDLLRCLMSPWAVVNPQTALQGAKWGELRTTVKRGITTNIIGSDAGSQVLRDKSQECYYFVNLRRSGLFKH